MSFLIIERTRKGEGTTKAPTRKTIMLGKLLCFIGVHDWEYRAFYDGTRLTHNYNLYHRCRRCSSQAWEPVKGTER